MQRDFFITIILMLSISLASCNSSRRAAGRIYSIVEDHPELLQADTVKIDTLLYIATDSDTAVFSLDSVQKSTKPLILHTKRGTFSVMNVEPRQFQIIYTPDTALIQYRNEIPISKIVIQQPSKWWETPLKIAVFLFMFLLFSVFLFGKVRKLSQK